VITPVAIGYIINGTGSFHGALLYVGLHVIGAVISYWAVVGPIKRFQIAILTQPATGGEMPIAAATRNKG
jgi:ACS family glucarate transporter-like MFS transporter